jgi:hypothetical protein
MLAHALIIKQMDEVTGIVRLAFRLPLDATKTAIGENQWKHCKQSIPPAMAKAQEG